jgi:hypothetical protein
MAGNSPLLKLALGVAAALLLGRRRPEQVQGPLTTFKAVLELSEAEKAERRDQARRDRWRLGVEILTLVGLGIGTGVAIMTLRSVRDSIDLANRSLRQTEALTRMSMDHTERLATANARIAEDTLVEMRQGTEATRAANRLTERQIAETSLATKNLQRARLSATLILEPKEPALLADEFHFRIRPIFSGATPAFRVRSHSNVNVANQPPPMPDWDKMFAETKTEGATLLPGQTSRTFTGPSTKFISQEALAAYQAQNLTSTYGLGSRTATRTGASIGHRLVPFTNTARR